MSRHFLMVVRLHADGMGTARYHGIHQGAPEWPPAPARVFQALVAGVARGQAVPETFDAALRWLERLPPPVIAAPPRTLGQAVSIYVPNNDADALANPSDVSSIRTAKRVQPSLFDGAQPLLYTWSLPDGELPEQALVSAAHTVCQLGRGVDMAWADACVLSNDELQTLLQRYRGIVHRPAPGATVQPMLPCPMLGSLDSLVQRHRAPRLRVEGAGKKARVLFTNPPKPRFVAVSYAPVRRLVLYDLRERGTTKPWPWPLQRAVVLVEQVRDAAAARLRQAIPDAADAIERCLIGRAANGSGAVPLAQRVRILPLPSIGAVHADQAIRRVLVEVPSGCPLAAEDLDWAFSGLDSINADTGELSPWTLTKADQTDMQTHYSVNSHHWQSVTGVALPEMAARRRIDPTRQQAEAKSADERQAEEERAVAAVQLALRHAGVLAVATQVRVQREPFTGRGKRAEAYAEGTRFLKERLWHVALSFDRPVAGPLAIGDGRFVGLGLLAPSAQASGFSADPATWTGEQSDGVFVVQTAGDATDGIPDAPLVLARALRRAVMARVRDALGPSATGSLNPYFSGHEANSNTPDARPTRHVAFHWDGPRRRWLVVAPHRLERRRAYTWERGHLAVLDRALEGLTDLRAGAAGRHAVQRAMLFEGDPFLAPATAWESVTPYDVTRHRRLSSAAEALMVDVLAECTRCGLPQPCVTVLDANSLSGRGLQARLRLEFAVPVAGPIALGRSSLLGGGLFSAKESADNPKHGLEDGLEDSDLRMAPTARSGAGGASARARSGSDLAEHGFRARDGGSGLAEGPARGTTQPADATRHFDTAEGTLNYSELARRLAEPLLRIDDRIRSGEFAERSMDADLLLAFHAALGADLFPEQAGRYRTVAVQVGAHEAPPPHQVAERILEYVRNLDARLQHLPDEPDDRWLEALAYAEGELLSIHPFPDLNGRISRLWMLELLRRMGLPPVDIVPSDADFRQRYLSALSAADRRVWQPLQALWRERLERAGEQP